MAGPRRGKRNVNGEGNIRQRPDGRWEGRAYVLTTDGREIRRSVYGSSWEAVHEKLTKLQADRIAGKRVTDTKLTVGEYLSYWLDELARDRMRDTTYAGRAQLIRRYLRPALGRKKLGQLTAADIRRAYGRLRQTCQCCALGRDKAREERAQRLRARRKAASRPRKNARPIEGARCCAKTPPECCEAYVSAGTILVIHRVLRAALQDAVREGILVDNPAKNVRLDERYRPRFQAWTGTEARQFLATVRTDRWYALYAVALSLGLRRGEALGLRWSDVDFADEVLYVRQSLHRAGGRLVFGPVKSYDSERGVALPRPCLTALREHRDRQADERRQAGDSWHEHGLVFTTSVGTPIEPRNLHRHFVRMCEKAGVRRIRFHDLRHSCATLLYEQGVPLENIQDVLGHSSPVITKMIYVEVTKKIQRKAIDRLDYLFEDDPGDEDDGPAVGAR
ncbi:MAG: site-specific integrase [Acidothermales bacterium]|nr:site-specific integrase [Acidothermales bacterium]